MGESRLTAQCVGICSVQCSAVQCTPNLYWSFVLWPTLDIEFEFEILLLFEIPDQQLTLQDTLPKSQFWLLFSVVVIAFFYLFDQGTG